MNPGEEIRRAQQSVEAEIARLLSELNSQQGVVVDGVHVEYLNGNSSTDATNECPVVRLHIET